jgi:hypothetical protein
MMKTQIEILQRRADKCECDGECDLNPPHIECRECKATRALNEAGELFTDALTLSKKEASLLSLHNRSEIKEGVPCVCYFCMQVIDGGDIEEWADDGDTAVCPRCNVDAIVPNETDVQYLLLAHMESFYGKPK